MLAVTGKATAVTPSTPINVQINVPIKRQWNLSIGGTKFLALGSTSSSGTLLDLRAIFFLSVVVAVTEGAVATGGAGSVAKKETGGAGKEAGEGEAAGGRRRRGVPA